MADGTNTGYITTEEIAEELGVEWRTNRVPAFLSTFGIRSTGTVTVDKKTRQVYPRDRVLWAVSLVKHFEKNKDD